MDRCYIHSLARHTKQRESNEVDVVAAAAAEDEGKMGRRDTVAGPLRQKTKSKPSPPTGVRRRRRG